MEEEILIYKKFKSNRQILFTLNKTNFIMNGTNKKYHKDYKIEDIKKLMRKDNYFIIELNNKKSYTLISENNNDWYSCIKKNIFNLNKIIKIDYLINKNKQNKNICCLLNEKYFQCFNIYINNDFEAIEKILDINLNDIIDIYSTNFDDEITCFTIELKNKNNYNFDAKTIEEKKKWIKKQEQQ